MREDCGNLSEVTVEVGHEIMLERPAGVNEAIATWLTSCPRFEPTIEGFDGVPQAVA